MSLDNQSEEIRILLGISGYEKELDELNSQIQQDFIQNIFVLISKN